MNSTNEAGAGCATEKMSSVIADQTHMFDLATGMASMLLCIANVKGEMLPAIGNEVDFMDYEPYFPPQSDDFPYSISAGSMKRLANDSNGNPVFESNLHNRRP